MPATQPKSFTAAPAPRDDKFRKVEPAKSRSHDCSHQRIEPERVPTLGDRVDQASMDSFPCSDPPGYHTCHC